MCWLAVAISPWRCCNFFAPLLACLWILVASAEKSCNGAPEFCELPLDYFTFPGTHNTGAFKLSTPSSMSVKNVGTWKDFLEGFGIRQWKECYYEHHIDNYMEQLLAGVRFLSPDLCLDDASDIVNCRSGTGERSDTAYGEKWDASLQAIRDYLSVYDTQIVMIRPEDMWDSVNAAQIQASVERVFGACLNSETGIGNLVVNATALKCLNLRDSTTDLNNFTLGALMDLNFRLIFSQANYKKTHDHTLEHSKWPDEFVDQLLTYSGTLPIVGEQVKKRQAMAMVEVDLFRSQRPSSGFVMCNSDMARELNEATLLGDHADLKHDAPKGTKCEYDRCEKYRSKLEVFHHQILNMGYTVGNIIVDRSDLGDLPKILNRINMANWRRFKGKLEPGVPWYKLKWVIVVFFITIPSVILFVTCCIVGFLKPQWCPTCIEKCFGCKKRERKKERKRRKKQEKALKALEKAGVLESQQEGDIVYNDDWQTGGYNGYGQAPPVGIYGQFQGTPQGNPWTVQRSAPATVSGNPWAAQGAPPAPAPAPAPENLQPINPWTAQGAAPTPAPQHLQPANPWTAHGCLPAALPKAAPQLLPPASQGFDPSASAPVNGYGGQRLPAAPAYNQTAMTASTPISQQWSVGPAASPQGVAPTSGEHHYCSTALARPGSYACSPVQLPPHGQQAAGQWYNGAQYPRGVATE